MNRGHWPGNPLHKIFTSVNISKCFGTKRWCVTSHPGNTVRLCASNVRSTGNEERGANFGVNVGRREWHGWGW